jgi:hypothetical protein
MKNIIIFDPIPVNPPSPTNPVNIAGTCNAFAGSELVHYFPDLLMHTDYYAFGMGMPGRTWSGTADAYRYSHNGHERENEIFANAQSAEYWMYDARLGRRWEKDPVVKSWESPYVAFNDNPILVADPKGLDGYDRAKEHQEKKGGELKNVGDGKWIVVNAELIDDPNATGGKGISYSETRFNDTKIERAGKYVSKKLSNLKNVFPERGKWDSDKNAESWVVQFDAGVRSKVNAGGMWQNSTEAKVTSRQEGYDKFVIENKTSSNLKIGEDNKMVSPFEKVETPGEPFISPFTVEAFAKASFSNQRKEDFCLQQRIPLNGQGAYIQINTAYDVITKTIRIQSVELGYSSDPKKTIETNVKYDGIIKVESDFSKKPGKTTSIAD